MNCILLSAFVGGNIDCKICTLRLICRAGSYCNVTLRGIR